MIRRTCLLSFATLALVLLSLPAVSQDAAPEPVIPAQEYADRAHRLREFGYPQYAREQLEAGARKYPTHKAIVLEHLRLLMRDRGNEITRWLKLALERYPYDYDIALEIAQYLYLNENEPIAPRPEVLEEATKRLKAEMTVFVSLADYILKPEPKLPPAADDSVTPAPMLPLAYLARCAKEKPNSVEVIEFAARYVDMLGFRFHGWAANGPDFALFGKAAADLFARAILLWDRAEDDPRYTGYARMRMAELYFRLGKYDEARKQADAADIAVPNTRAVGEILQGIAEKTGDFELLVKALERKRDAFPNETSRLDVSAAKRVRDNDWSMELWLTWLDLRGLKGPARTSAARALVKDHPAFIELHFVDAALIVELALSPDPPGDYTRMLESALGALDRCKGLNESLVDWHGLRATVLWSLGRYTDAASAFDRVAELDPKDPQAPRYAKAARDIAAKAYTARDWDQYRQATESYGNLKETLQTLRDITARSPRFFEAQLAVSELALMFEEFEVSLAAATAVLGLVPDNLNALDNAANAAMRLQKYELAAKHFQRIHEVKPGFHDADRWHELCAWAAAKPAGEQTAVKLWLESNNRSLRKTDKRIKLEDAVRNAPMFAEALIDLAQLEHERGEDQHALELLQTAQENTRDNKWIRALIHRTRGTVLAKQRKTDRAVAEFEAAYSVLRGDGGDLMLAALALHSVDDHANASAAMRKLFTECPDTLLLRPTPSEIHQLDLLPPKREEQTRRFSPAYSAGDRLRFRVAIVVSGEGRGQMSDEVRTEFDMNVEVLEVPLHGGVWKIKATFADPPAPAWEMLTQIQATARISPWFGLCEEPESNADDKMQDVIYPAIQALTEGFTAGLGDAPVAAPFRWKNNMTKGPPHFGNADSSRDYLPNPEGSYLSSVTGDSFTITRRALAGRRLAGEQAREQTFGRGLEAVVQAGGPRNALRKVSFDVAKEELTPEHDDVIRTRLQVSITAK